MQAHNLQEGNWHGFQRDCPMSQWAHDLDRIKKSFLEKELERYSGSFEMVLNNYHNTDNNSS